VGKAFWGEGAVGDGGRGKFAEDELRAPEEARRLNTHHRNPIRIRPIMAYTMPDKIPLELFGVVTVESFTDRDCLQSFGQLRESSPRLALQIPSSLQNELSLTDMVKAGWF
jgi:hypothetical protein